MKALALLLLAGCGLGIEGSSSGGGDNLPSSGAGPYKRLDTDLSTPAQEPFVLASRSEDYSDPECRARDGGGWRCWITLRRQGDAHTSIGYAEIGDLHQLPDVAPSKVFGPTDTDVARPALADGPNGTLLLYHDVGGDIALATSFDGGMTFTDDAATGLSPASSATVALVDGVYHVFFVRDGAIWHGTSDHGTDFTIDPAPAIAPRPDLDGAFDQLGVGDPYLYVTTSDAGRHHWGLFFTGVAAPPVNAPDAGPEGRTTSIGYAASFDGTIWQRAAGLDPILDAPAAGPCVVPDGASTVLLFQEEQRLHLGVAAAVP